MKTFVREIIFNRPQLPSQHLALQTPPLNVKIDVEKKIMPKNVLPKIDSVKKSNKRFAKINFRKTSKTVCQTTSLIKDLKLSKNKFCNTFCQN